MNVQILDLRNLIYFFSQELREYDKCCLVYFMATHNVNRQSRHHLSSEQKHTSAKY